MKPKFDEETSLYELNYKVGDKVRIIAQFYGHGFEIGDELELTEGRDWNGDYFIGEWLVREDEIELVEPVLKHQQ